MLKEYRIKKRISQEQLESLTNLDRKTIFRIENNISMPLLDTFAKLCLALELKSIKLLSNMIIVFLWINLIYLIYS